MRTRRAGCACPLFGWLVCAALAAAAAPSLRGQAADASRQELQAQVDAMQSRLEAAQRQIDQDHAELLELRRQIEALARPTSSAAPNDSATDLQRAVADLQERQALQQAEIQVHEQEKVESATKYSLKVHGLVLVNASVNNGASDQPSAALIAVPAASGSTAANGSLTATGRQTLLGLAATGPTLWGARTYANLDMDFAGGDASGGYATGSNLLRLRTAAMEMAWPKTTVRAGISPLILTPAYATSYFSVAEPAMSWSGSLWSWLPQLSVAHRVDISDAQRLTLQAALADIPDAGTGASSGLGAVSAAERSRFPGSEVRAAWEGKERLPASFGIGGYWSPHSYATTSSGPGGGFDAWAATADWRVSLPAKLQFSGALYEGAALGGLGAGAFKDYLPVNIPLAGPSVGARPAALKDAGGWAQLQFKPGERWEFNFAFGQDNANSGQLRRAGLVVASPFVGLARNQTGFGNVVFRPRANIILSGEYRKMRSWQLSGPADDASLLGLAAGYEF